MLTLILKNQTETFKRIVDTKLDKNVDWITWINWTTINTISVGLIKTTYRSEQTDFRPIS